MTKPDLMRKCVNAHDRCEGSAPCPYCEPVWPLRDESGKFVSAKPPIPWTQHQFTSA